MIKISNEPNINDEFVKNKLEEFENELVQIKQSNNQIKNKIFLEYLVIKICAVYEETIKQIFRKKFERSFGQNFDPDFIIEKVKILQEGNLIKMFKFFKPNLEKDFFDDYENACSYLGIFNDLVRKRNQAAHNLKSSFHENPPTIKELKEKHEKLKKMLELLEKL